MPIIALSDVHLRLDHPERGERLRELVRTLDPAADRLVIGGDLCDFWFAARQSRLPEVVDQCPGLSALRDFRARGGALILIAGNHDAWLGPFYERALGVGFVPEPLTFEAGGRRVHLVHGHRVGARPAWKAWMESRVFLESFRALPEPVARRLARTLDRTNDRGRARSDLKHLALFGRYARDLADRADLVLFGHIHGPRDDPADSEGPRRVVLGGWHRGASWLVIPDDPARRPEAVVRAAGDPAAFPKSNPDG